MGWLDYQDKKPIEYLFRHKSAKKFEKVFQMLLKIKYDFFSNDDTLPRILENKLISHEQLDKIYLQYKGTLKLKHIRRLMKYPGYEKVLKKMEKSCIIDHPRYKERL
jgi:hypothetical protein